DESRAMPVLGGPVGEDVAAEGGSADGERPGQPGQGRRPRDLFYRQAGDGDGRDVAGGAEGGATEENGGQASSNRHPTQATPHAAALSPVFMTKTGRETPRNGWEKPGEGRGRYHRVEWGVGVSW